MGLSKVVVVLYKRPDLSWEEFRRYWREQHAARALRIPGLRRYVHNDAPEPGNPPYGIAELSFDSVDALRAGLASPEGQAALGDLANFADPDRTGLVVVEPAGIIEVITADSLDAEPSDGWHEG